MSELIEIAGRSLVIGLEWSLHPNKASMREALKEAGQRVMHIVRPNDDGLLLGVANGKVPATAVPAALAIAAAHGEAIVFHQVAADQVWVCAIMNATPLSGMDVLVPASEARTLVTDLVSHQPGAIIIGTLAGASLTLEAALGALGGPQAKALRLKPSGMSWTLLAAMVGLPLLLIGAFLLVKQASARSEALRAAAEDAKAAMLQQENERARQARLVNEFKAQVLRQRDQLAQGVPAWAQYRQWREALAGVRLLHEGYLLDEVLCERREGGMSSCTLRWKNAGTLTTRAAPTSALSLPGHAEAQEDADPLLLSAAALSTLVLTQLGVIDLPADEPGYPLRLAARLQRLGIDPLLQAAVPVVVTPDAGVAAAVGGPATLGRRGQWSAQVPTLIHADALAQETRGSSLRLRSLRVEGIAGRRLQVKLEGEYVSSAKAR